VKTRQGTSDSGPKKREKEGATASTVLSNWVGVCFQQNAYPGGIWLRTQAEGCKNKKFTTKDTKEHKVELPNSKEELWKDIGRRTAREMISGTSGKKMRWFDEAE